MRMIRIFFGKKGESVYISHLDLQRVMARALRRSGLPVWYSQGFNPHIYMSFALPLSLGHASEVEAVDCKTESKETDFSAYLPALNKALPKGIEAYKIAEPVHTAAEIAKAEYYILYPSQGEEAVRRAVEGYAALPEAMVLRKTKRSEQQVDLKTLGVAPELQKGEYDGVYIKVILPAGNEGNINPDLLCGLLRERFGMPMEDAVVLRTKVLTADGKEFC